MRNETTDVAVVKEVIIFARYLGIDRKLCTAFIGMMDVSDGTAKSIVAALQKQELIDIDNKLVTIGSDGTITIGARGEVATPLWVCVIHAELRSFESSTGRVIDGIID